MIFNLYIEESFLILFHSFFGFFFFFSKFIASFVMLLFWLYIPLVAYTFFCNSLLKIRKKRNITAFQEILAFFLVIYLTFLQKALEDR